MVTCWTLLTFLLLDGGLADYSSPPLVTTSSGKLRGTFMKTRSGKEIEAYLGIPFAKPPLGQLRFELSNPIYQPAQPAVPWRGVRMADSMPPACMQDTSEGPISEDCLYLNVFTPGSQSTLDLPVMVWIHGGSFRKNGISTFTPEYLLDLGNIVLAIIQYRLGYFGFLSTNDSVMPGNQGLKDQRLALRWVRDNIRRFGGDPSKVTIFGQSAGAMCVHALMLFASKEGLFRAGISQSGVSLMSAAFRLPREVSYMVETIASKSGCPSDSRGLVSCLKEKPAESILSLVPPNQLFNSQPTPGLVLEPDCVPDRIVSENPWNLRVELPWLTGVMDKEILEFVAGVAADETNRLFATFQANFEVVLPNSLNYQYSSANGSGVPTAIRDFYFRDEPIARATFAQFVEALTDAFFIYPIFEAVLRSNVSQTYMYMFEYIGANHNYKTLPPNETVGAAHEDDVFFFFPHPKSIKDGRNFSKSDDALSKTLVKLWTNFATTLQPTAFLEELQWKPFGFDQYYYTFGKCSIHLNSQFLPERMNFWKNQQYIYRDDNIEPILCTRRK